MNVEEQKKDKNALENEKKLKEKRIQMQEEMYKKIEPENK